MAIYKSREERKALFLSARMLADEGWCDVTVCNVSSSGMMLRCQTPPRRNTFIEVRHGRARVVARVIWSDGARFGVRTQDAIDLSGLLSQTPAGAKDAAGERRMRPRAQRAPASQMRVLSAHEASRTLARLTDWSAVAFAVALGAMVLAGLAREALQPLDRVGHALASTSPGR